MLFHVNDAEFLKGFLKNNWWKHIVWNIDERRALDIALHYSVIVGGGNYSYSIRRYIAILHDGLYPIYRVRIKYNEQYQDIYINAYNGEVINANSGVVIGLNNYKYSDNELPENFPKWLPIMMGLAIVITIAITLSFILYRLNGRR